MAKRIRKRIHWDTDQYWKAFAKRVLKQADKERKKADESVPIGSDDSA